MPGILPLTSRIIPCLGDLNAEAPSDRTTLHPCTLNDAGLLHSPHGIGIGLFGIASTWADRKDRGFPYRPGEVPADLERTHLLGGGQRAHPWGECRCPDASFRSFDQGGIRLFGEKQPGMGSVDRSGAIGGGEDNQPLPEFPNPGEAGVQPGTCIGVRSSRSRVRSTARNSMSRRPLSSTLGRKALRHQCHGRDRGFHRL